MKNEPKDLGVVVTAAPERTPRGRYALALALLLAGGGLSYRALAGEKAAPPAPPAVVSGEKPADARPIPAGRPVDLVICLDTSGSMEGLIESVKRKLWDVANQLAQAKPTPKLRVALVAYGSPEYGADGGFVRTVVPFTEDLDKLQEKLFALRTSGGEEYVGVVLKTALAELAWEKDDGALKIAFVCGNEPASQGPVAFSDSCRAAAARGVVVNAVYCGGAQDGDAEGWRNVATIGHGRFASIAHNEAVLEIATPFDKELALLSTRLNGTYVPIGRAGRDGCENQTAQDSNSNGLGLSSGASRAQAKASAVYRCVWDAYDAKIDLEKVRVEDLPGEMKKLTLEERKAYVAKKAAERETIRKEIAELGKKREAFVAEERKKQSGASKNAIDEAMRGAIREQAEARGFKFGGC